MKVIVSADDTGSAKEVICNEGTDTSKQNATQPISIDNCLEPSSSVKSRIIHFLSFNYQYLIGARLGGQVSVYELSDEESEEKFKLLHNFELPVDAQDKPVALLRWKFWIVYLLLSNHPKFLIHINDSFDFKPLELVLPEYKPISALQSTRKPKISSP